ncbi:MAG: hypothetical protein R3F43_11815 [bacterium]
MTGVAALMVVMGGIGTLVMGAWLVLLLTSGVMSAGFMGVLMLLLGLGFFVVPAPARGLRLLWRFDFRRFRADADQYFMAAVVSTVVACVLMLFGGLAKGGVVGLLMILPVAGILLTWPSIVRDAGTVELRPDLEDDGPPVRLSRDHGLVTLGLAILTLGVFGLVSLAFVASLLPASTRPAPR